jgi:hypothetical protein
MNEAGSTFLAVNGGGLFIADASFYPLRADTYDRLSIALANPAGSQRERREGRGLKVALDDTRYEILIMPFGMQSLLTAIVYGEVVGLNLPSQTLTVADLAMVDTSINVEEDYNVIQVVGLPRQLLLRVGLYIRHSKSLYALSLLDRDYLLDELESSESQEMGALIEGICVEWLSADDGPIQSYSPELLHGEAVFHSLRTAVGEPY